MEFKEIVKNRRSVRQYQDKAVPEETIHELLEMIGFSVSAINLQPWKIKVVSDQETKDKLFAATFGMNQVEHVLPSAGPVRRHRLPGHHRQARQGAWPRPAVPDEMRQGIDRYGHQHHQRHDARAAAAVVAGTGVHRPGQRGQRRLLARSGRLPHDRLPGRTSSRASSSCPTTVVPTVMVSVGYPADGQPAPKLRHPVERHPLSSRARADSRWTSSSTASTPAPAWVRAWPSSPGIRAFLPVAFLALYSRLEFASAPVLDGTPFAFLEKTWVIALFFALAVIELAVDKIPVALSHPRPDHAAHQDRSGRPGVRSRHGSRRLDRHDRLPASWAWSSPAWPTTSAAPPVPTSRATPAPSSSSASTRTWPCSSAPCSSCWCLSSARWSPCFLFLLVYRVQRRAQAQTQRFAYP